MNCTICGENIDLNSLNDVLFHEHIGLECDANITGCLVEKSFTKEESINIEKISFNKDDSTMDLTYRNTGTYRYFDLPEYLFKLMSDAQNPGKFLHEKIKGNFRYHYIN